MMKFFNEHPFIGLLMVIAVCESTIEVATIVKGGERTILFPAIGGNKKENDNDNESVKE